MTAGLTAEQNDALQGLQRADAALKDCHGVDETQVEKVRAAQTGFAKAVLAADCNGILQHQALQHEKAVQAARRWLSARQQRPKHYLVKRTAVLLSSDAVELADAGVEPAEIRRTIKKRLEAIAGLLERAAAGESVTEFESRRAMYAARLILDEDTPDLIAAQKAIARLAGHLGTMSRQSWSELLETLLES